MERTCAGRLPEVSGSVCAPGIAQTGFSELPTKAATEPVHAGSLVEVQSRAAAAAAPERPDAARAVGGRQLLRISA